MMMREEVLFGGCRISTVQVVIRSGHEDEVAFNVPTGVCVPYPALLGAKQGMTTFNVRCQRNHGLTWLKAFCGMVEGEDPRLEVIRVDGHRTGFTASEWEEAREARDKDMAAVKAAWAAKLYGADPECEHDVETRMSGVGCRKCPGWFCH